MIVLRHALFPGFRLGEGKKAATAQTPDYPRRDRLHRQKHSRSHRAPPQALRDRGDHRAEPRRRARQGRKPAPTPASPARSARIRGFIGERRCCLPGPETRRSPPGPLLVVAAAAEPADCVLAAIVGAAGLSSTFEAARQGRRLALANKECLVSARRCSWRAAAAGTGCAWSTASTPRQCGARRRAPAEHRADLGPRHRAARFAPGAGAIRAPRRRGLAPPQLVDGREDHCRFRHGLMNKSLEAHRGLSPVSRARRPARHRRAPAAVSRTASRAMPMARRLRNFIARHAHLNIALALSWPRRMATPTPRLDLVALWKPHLEGPRRGALLRAPGPAARRWA